MDFNVQFDVTSARYLLERYSPTLIPIEVTAQTALRWSHFPSLYAMGPFGQLLARQAEAFATDEQYEQTYGRECAGLPDDFINFLHDPLACAVALGWEGVTREQFHVGLQSRDGWLHERVGVDGAGQPMTVVTAVEGAQFDAFWLRTITR